MLVVGGSQGALAINRAISAQIRLFEKHQIQLNMAMWKWLYEEAKSLVEAAELTDIVKVTSFINRMDLAYAAADLVVSRAGAMAIAELAVVQKAVIFVPLPTAAEDHQTKMLCGLLKKERHLWCVMKKQIKYL